MDMKTKDADAERSRAERILGAVAQVMRGSRSTCLFGVVRDDGAVLPWMDGTAPWASVEDFKADAAMQGRASALLERRHGEGYFGAGVVLPSGAVVEAEGRRRRWRSERAFLKAAGSMGADLVRWRPGRRVRNGKTPPEDALR